MRTNSSWGLWPFVSAYLALLLFAAVVLYSPLVRRGGLRPPGSLPPVGDFRDLLLLLQDADRERLLSGLDSDAIRGPVNCSTLHEVRDVELVAAGWTKAVYRARFRGSPLALKTVNLRGPDLRPCHDGDDVTLTLSQCYRRAVAKMLKELVLLSRLAPHPHVVKVLGWCVGVQGAVVATELGRPLDTLQMLQLSAEHRLQLVVGLARLLHRLAHSPLGSLAMNDLRRQQFVVGQEEGGPRLMLTDADDLGLAEPTCRRDTDCRRHHPLAPNASWSLLCVEGECRGHNERINVWRAGRHFVRHLLPDAVQLVDAYERADTGADEILQATEQLVFSHRQWT